MTHREIFDVGVGGSEAIKQVIDILSAKPQSNSKTGLIYAVLVKIIRNYKNYCREVLEKY